MPTYRVHFERPVVYLADSLRRREVSSLDVNGAPDGQAAIVHALRVTTGDPGAVTATLHPVEQVQSHG